jgi:hypothetical protein
MGWFTKLRLKCSNCGSRFFFDGWCEECGKPEKTSCHLKDAADTVISIKFEPEPEISEPVISLGKSLLVLEDWEMHSDHNALGVTIWTLEHVKKDLTLTFHDYRSITCYSNWMTKDERAYIGEKMRERLALKAQVENAIERQKFMVLVTSTEA